MSRFIQAACLLLCCAYLSSVEAPRPALPSPEVMTPMNDPSETHTQDYLNTVSEAWFMLQAARDMMRRLNDMRTTAQVPHADVLAVLNNPSQDNLDAYLRAGRQRYERALMASDAMIRLAP